MRWTTAAEMDRALGIDTSLTDRDWSARRRHPCQPTPAEALMAVETRLKTDDRVVDYGCGTGRAVFWLAAAGFAVTGVELDERRYADAEENLRRCAKKAPETAARVRLECAAAQDWNPAGATAFYCFNPFPAAVLRGVLKRIDAACADEVRMFCYYPDDEWTETLEFGGWQRTESVDLRDALGNDPRERVDVWTRVEWQER